MNRILPLLISLVCLSSGIQSQITTPIIRANFGVDADLRSNFFGGFVQSGNDDWFMFPGSAGTGKFIIDTTGAASIVAGYTSNPASRNIPFYRPMIYPPFSIVNNRLLIDGVYIRDYNGQIGNDSTFFVNANKNGQSPGVWNGGNSSLLPGGEELPAKTDIGDVLMHVRRAGPTITDSLWFFGGISLQSGDGERYFDFELYQTDIYYDRASKRFYNYGPDAGHTSWKFNAAGDVASTGDIIFSAVYQSLSLTSIEARIWVSRSDWENVIPTGFSWAGEFNGATNTSNYGYANIVPNSAGTYYSGLQGSNNTWAGPFGFINATNTLVSSYPQRQFMEFSVNLTKLGLDPVNLIVSGDCGMPFRRGLVKTRTSASLTSSLKDFIGPFDFFLAPRANAAADIYLYCGQMGVSQLDVTDPLFTSVYTWTTSNGHIIGSNIGPSVQVDMPGVYIVTQQLQAGCSTYATDTITIHYDAGCNVLNNRLTDFRGELKNGLASLDWSAQPNDDINYFEIERSTDGLHFKTVKRIYATPKTTFYDAIDDVQQLTSTFVFYRLKMRTNNGTAKYSKVVVLSLPDVLKTTITIGPNPVEHVMNINFMSTANNPLLLTIYDAQGKVMRTIRGTVQSGNSMMSLTGFESWPKGLYVLKAVVGKEVLVERIALTK